MIERWDIKLNNRNKLSFLQQIYLVMQSLGCLVQPLLKVIEYTVNQLKNQVHLKNNLL